MNRMSNKIILTDCDGVLLDWGTHFHNWMVARGFKLESTLDTKTQLLQQMDHNDIMRYVIEFNNSDAILDMPAYLDARSGVAMLVEHGYKFICISSVGMHPVTHALRTKNLENVFGKDVFIDLICLFTGADKTEALEPYRDSDFWWIDDKSEHAIVGANMGLRSIIVDRPHNCDLDHPGITRCRTWAEICMTISSHEY